MIRVLLHRVRKQSHEGGGLSVPHEVDDERGERGVERSVLEWQLLGRGLADVDAGIPLAAGDNERPRRVDGRHGVGSDTLDELAGEAAGPAADVEHPHPGPDAGRVGEGGRELGQVATHQAVVLLSRDVEAHPAYSR